MWLPDAMAGPTPVSALIHAATMVTAGVYLVARSAVIFSLAPVASLTVAFVGALTALFAATIGLKQWDIKKVLAYSTVSQLGYMFVGVGVGAYAAGIFHLVTHAFFKALLFLGSGSVIFAMHRAYHHTGSHEDAQDMRNMGGLRRYMPVTFVLMWIATLAICRHSAVRRLLLQGRDPGRRVRAGARLHAGRRALAGPSRRIRALRGVRLRRGRRAADRDLHDAHDALHLPRTRIARASRNADTWREAPWIMTGPLVVLGVLSARGRVAQPAGVLPGWSDAGAGALAGAGDRGGIGAHNGGRGAPVARDWSWAWWGWRWPSRHVGIALAMLRLKPERWCRKAQAPEATGFERVLEHKYYVDEAYDRAIVEPVVGLSRGPCCGAGWMWASSMDCW